MGVVPAVGPVPKVRRLRSGSTVLMTGLGVVLAIGLISLVIADQRAADPSTGTLGGAEVPAAGLVIPAPQPLVVSHAVTYELIGDGGALNITYVTQGSDIAQVVEAATPWSVSPESKSAAEGTRYYSLSAQDAGPGTLKCRITVDGTVVSERSVAGPHGVVRCSKSLT